ncbi:MAG: hypothetical protein HYZ14_10785 [Bacteroidetes bacterium]|nr:hypothetical protein [Bacteroidota bacterium]
MTLFISILFLVTTLLTLFLLYLASGKSRICLAVCLGWIIFQYLLANSQFYTVTNTIPPRLLLLIGPPVLTILLLFSTQRGRRFIDGFNPGQLILINTVRIPVELFLYWLFLQKTIPELMTFAGRNPDILTGISAPLIYYFFYRRKKNKTALLIWNFAGMILLFNVVIHGILSAPSPFQQLAFEQPNTAVLQAPYNLLPAFIVPVVLLTHLAGIRLLVRQT